MEKRVSEQNKTPESKFDEAILYESMYGFAIWTVLFLFIGIAFFVGLMPIGLSVTLAGVFITCLVALVLSPLLFENNAGRLNRRVALCYYFPVKKRAFVFSKLKYVAKYSAIFWICSLGAQIIAVPFWNFTKLVSYQGALLGFTVLWTSVYLLIGCCGNK